MSVIEGLEIDPSRTPTRGGGKRPMPVEASVLDSALCYRQVAVFVTRFGVNAARAIGRAVDRCAELNLLEAEEVAA